MCPSPGRDCATVSPFRRRLADLRVDAIVLSNHGGRQLDRAPIPFHLLPEVVREVVSEYEIHLDTGIMSGADIVVAVALGARFTLVGRAYLYGLMAGNCAAAKARGAAATAGQTAKTSDGTGRRPSAVARR